MTTFAASIRENPTIIVGDDATEEERKIAYLVAIHHDNLIQDDFSSEEVFMAKWRELSSSELPSLSVSRIMEIAQNVFEYRQRLEATCS